MTLADLKYYKFWGFDSCLVPGLAKPRYGSGWPRVGRQSTLHQWISPGSETARSVYTATRSRAYGVCTRAMLYYIVLCIVVIIITTTTHSRCGAYWLHSAAAAKVPSAPVAGLSRRLGGVSVNRVKSTLGWRAPKIRVLNRLTFSIKKKNCCRTRRLRFFSWGFVRLKFWKKFSIISLRELLWFDRPCRRYDVNTGSPGIFTLVEKPDNTTEFSVRKIIDIKKTLQLIKQLP